MSNTKARHLQALAGRLSALNSNLEETELLFAALSHQQLCMREFAIAHGALFMAQSRLIDVELEEENKAQAAQGNVRVDQQ